MGRRADVDIRAWLIASLIAAGAQELAGMRADISAAMPAAMLASATTAEQYAPRRPNDHDTQDTGGALGAP
ncbi:hypothetical protein JCM14124_15840 [Humidesulfovibrio idahonensis]